MTSNMKKRAVQSSAVALTLVTMTCGVVVSNPRVVVPAARTAGIIHTLNVMENSAMAKVEVEQSEIVVVAASQEASPWDTRLMANVEEFLYVREGASEESNIVGKLYKGDVAEIVSHAEGWTQITSGNVSGYVSDAYCVMGSEAEQLANAVCTTYATSQVEGLRVRGEAGQESSIYKTVSKGDKLTVATDVEAPEGWVPVKLKSSVGYVSSDYVEVALELGTGVTIEEEQARIAAEEAARKAEEAKRAQARSAARVQNEAVAVSYDDVTLLAALIQCEAGSESYEGQLAVGAVVMNRLRSGSYPGSLYGVIYQSGQFGPASRGAVARVAASGPRSSCIQAAQEALNGADNTGGALCFKNASSGHAGVVIGSHVFF